MRELAIREHLKMLLRIRSNWDWTVQFSSGFFVGKITIYTHNGRLTINKQQLEEHIERTKFNLGRARELRQIRRQEVSVR